MGEFYEWLKNLKWTEEHKKLDRQIVDSINSEARSRRLM